MVEMREKETGVPSIDGVILRFKLPSAAFDPAPVFVGVDKPLPFDVLQ